MDRHVSAHPWKSAWVTGASTGIGRELALRLARSGVRVAASARSAAKLVELASLDRNIMPVALDVTLPADVVDAHQRIVATLGPIDLAVLNARLRKRWRAGVRFGVIGERPDLTYDYDYLGAGPETLADLMAGKGAFAEILKGAKKPLIIVGAGIAGRSDGEAAA